MRSLTPPRARGLVVRHVARPTGMQTPLTRRSRPTTTMARPTSRTRRAHHRTPGMLGVDQATGTWARRTRSEGPAARYANVATDGLATTVAFPGRAHTEFSSRSPLPTLKGASCTARSRVARGGQVDQSQRAIAVRTGPVRTG